MLQLVLGIIVGAGGAWFYYRSRGQTDFAAANVFVDRTKETVTTGAAAVAQRTSDAIEAAPVPSQVKDAVADAASASQGGMPAEPQGQKPDYIGTPGVESALGRDRTQDGDVPSDLAKP